MRQHPSERAAAESDAQAITQKMRSVPNVATAATIWFSVKDEIRMPIAMNAAP